MRTAVEEAAISYKGAEEPCQMCVDSLAHSTQAEVPDLLTIMPMDDSD